MSHAERTRPGSVLALMSTAIVMGGFVGFVASGFLWLVQKGTKLLWTDLPEQVGVAPYDSWWLFAVPVAGGVLVGLGQRVLGNYPRSIDEAMAVWKGGGHLEPVEAPKTFVNALVALTTGGPVGFEAALTGIIGGCATVISRRVGTVSELVRDAWGADHTESVPRSLHEVPYILAAVAGLFAFHWSPLGGLDLGFRFAPFDGDLAVKEGAAAFVLAALVVVPVAWAISAVRRAEAATFFRRSPILIGMAGGVVFALLALPEPLVLFSGQQGIQQLPDAGNLDLAYVTVVKWLALVVALLAGWRGGPIFPTYTAVAAFAVLASEVVDITPDILMVGAISAVSLVFLKGRIPLAFVLTLYPVPLSYAAVILIGCVGAAAALAVARASGVLPADALPDESADADPDPEAAPDAPAT